MYSESAEKKSPTDQYPFLRNSKVGIPTFFEAARAEVIIGAIMLVLVLVFNYFNVVPLSKNFPSLFGFLPHHTEPGSAHPGVTTVLPTPGAVSDPKTVPFLSCPVPQLLCRAGVNSIKNVDGEKEYSLTFNDVSKEEFVYAVLSGVVAIENPKSFSIKDVERGLEVRYILSDELIFTTEVKNGSKVTEKQVIGNFAKEKNSITLIATGIVLKESIQLGTEKGGNYLTNAKGM